MRFTRTTIAGGAAALAVVAGGGGAIAATHGWGSPSQTRAAILKDVAGRLGVQQTALEDAFKAAAKDQVEAAVTAGTLTRAQADAIEARIASGEFPLFSGPMGHGGMHHGEELAAAATYLGLTEAQLRTQLESGKTLADLAKAQGKSVDGLVQALVDAEKTELDAAVQSGRLTAAQEQQLLAQLKQHATDEVNGKLGPGRHEMHGPPGMPGM